MREVEISFIAFSDCMEPFNDEITMFLRDPRMRVDGNESLVQVLAYGTKPIRILGKRLWQE